MPTTPKTWPSHGNAKDARDESAELALSIQRHADQLMDLKQQGRLSELELVYRLALISREAGKISLWLVGEGAPTRPYQR